MPNQCLFCDTENLQIIGENDLSFAVRDKYPVTELHTLIISKKHYETVFDLPAEEMASILELAKTCRQAIADEDRSVEGFNFGSNTGEVAGQMISHVHFHLIPRRTGDLVPPFAG